MATPVEALAARALPEKAREVLFTAARTKQFFHDKPVPEATLRALYDLAKWGPTAANTCPLRVTFVRTAEAKAKLAPLAMDTNREKVLGAPVVAILAWDTEYFEHLPRLMPPLAFYKDVLKGSPDRGAGGGQLSAHLQAGYFILAARTLGLDAGPMGGFSAEGVDKAFFAEGTPRGHWKSFMLVSLGYGDDSKVYPRADRFAFDEVCTIE